MPSNSPAKDILNLFGEYSYLIKVLNIDAIRLLLILIFYFRILMTVTLYFWRLMMVSQEEQIWLKIASRWRARKLLKSRMWTTTLVIDPGEKWALELRAR